MRIFVVLPSLALWLAGCAQEPPAEPVAVGPPPPVVVEKVVPAPAPPPKMIVIEKPVYIEKEKRVVVQRPASSPRPAPAVAKAPAPAPGCSKFTKTGCLVTRGCRWDKGYTTVKGEHIRGTCRSVSAPKR